jgi:hypothetical protein
MCLCLDCPSQGEPVIPNGHRVACEIIEEGAVKKEMSKIAKFLII